MSRYQRREFLQEVGRGMLAIGLGASAAEEFGILPKAFGEEDGPALKFGRLEPLVALLQETPAEKVISAIVEKFRGGAPLGDLVAAGALANARSFGGEDYVGFHTLMALSPSFHMAMELPEELRLLPVLKVLYRNTTRIQECGGEKAEVLRPVEPAALPQGQPGYEILRRAVREKDLDAAERTFAALAAGAAQDAYDQLLYTVQDATEVHRVVLPYRAWDLLDLIGREHAHTLLRQSVRYCLRSEKHGTSDRYTRSRTLLPKLMEEHHLLGMQPGTRPLDDAALERLSETIFKADPDAAAETAAVALAEGVAPGSIGEAISLAANQLVLRDQGRREREVQPGKPLGSVHGDSIGVHASDSANAWRNMARGASDRNLFAGLILGAYQVALDRVGRGGDFLNWLPHPHAGQLEKIQAADPGELLRELEGAIRENDQARAAALVHRYGDLGHPARAVFKALLRYAVSEDGALHAEKYYRTVSEEFEALRPKFRWRQLVGLARVTASEYGKTAPGYPEAIELLGIRAG